VLNDDGAVVEVSVELGLRGDMVSQVLSGLEEGQTVAVELTPTSVFDEMMDN
jgi:multidrug efflux pump subunit AcrA (membrane-fusion protein)